MIGALAKELGFKQVSLSSDLVPMVRIVPRGHTAAVDAYLTPNIQDYLKGFLSGKPMFLNTVKTPYPLVTF
jgi:5-oxoprolinase (ATP-hydrolysing)